jgi:hypothetical protein
MPGLSKEETKGNLIVWERVVDGEVLLDRREGQM